MVVPAVLLVAASASVAARAQSGLVVAGARIGNSAWFDDTIVQASAGRGHALELYGGGSITAWGHDFNRQCVAPALPAGSHCVEIVAGGSHTVARRSDGSIIVWGANNHGQCVAPPLLPGVAFVDVSAGSSHTVARYERVCGAAGCCTPGTSSSGCTAMLSSSGSPSASLASPFVVTASYVEGQKLGLILYGLSGATSLPWGATSSLLCLKPAPQLTTHGNNSGTAGACDGALVLDWSACVSPLPTALGQPLRAGDLEWLQGWCRDPPSSKTAAPTDRLEVLVCS